MYKYRIHFTTLGGEDRVLTREYDNEKRARNFARLRLGGGAACKEYQVLPAIYVQGRLLRRTDIGTEVSLITPLQIAHPPRYGKRGAIRYWGLGVVFVLFDGECEPVACRPEHLVWGDEVDKKQNTELRCSGFVVSESGSPSSCPVNTWSLVGELTFDSYEDMELFATELSKIIGKTVGIEVEAKPCTLRAEAFLSKSCT